MKYALLLTGLLAVMYDCFAQTYFTTAGLRVGTDFGLTVKQRIARRTTLEGILQSSLARDEGMFTLLAEQHAPLITRGFNVYAGAGVHLGWSTTKPLYGQDPQEAKGPSGLSLIAGAEITLFRFNVSYDFKPAINISGGEKPFYFQSGISARYVLVKKPLWDEKNKKRRNGRSRHKGGFRLW